MWTHGHIGDVLTLIQNGVNCKQDKSGVGDKITRIETIADSSINYEKTGFAELDDKQKAKALLESGDILFSHINSPIHVGKTAIYDGQEPLFHGINLLRLRTIEQVDSSYFNMFLVSLFQSGYWKRTAKQSVNQASVNQTDIKSVPFSYPPLAEQQRIVAKLDAAFAEIDKAIESYEDSVSNAKDCLSKVRASRVTEVLSSSQTAKLGSLASLKNGLNYNKSEKGYSIKILGVGDFGNRFSIGTEDLKVIETNSPVSTDYHLEHGDIVFVRSNGNKQLIGRSIVIENPSEPATFSGFCIRCRIETADMSPLFLCHYLKSSVVRDKLISGGGGANISNLNQKMLADIDVPLLSQHEQISLIRWIEELEKSFEDFVATLIKRVQLADNLKSAILSQELQPPQSEAA